MHAWVIGHRIEAATVVYLCAVRINNRVSYGETTEAVEYQEVSRSSSLDFSWKDAKQNKFENEALTKSTDKKKEATDSAALYQCLFLFHFKAESLSGFYFMGLGGSIPKHNLSRVCKVREARTVI